jgi:hypothetical protein
MRCGLSLRRSHNHRTRSAIRASIAEVEREGRPVTPQSLAAVFGAALMLAGSASAKAEQLRFAQAQTVPCDAFQRNPNGTWSPTRQITITLPNNSGQISLGPGVSFGSGVRFGGIDLYSLLEQNCR